LQAGVFRAFFEHAGDGHHFALRYIGVQDQGLPDGIGFAEKRFRHLFIQQQRVGVGQTSFTAQQRDVEHIQEVVVHEMHLLGEHVVAAFDDQPAGVDARSGRCGGGCGGRG